MNFVPIRRLLPVRFVLVVVLALSCRSFAFDDWRPISQEELKMTSEPLAPGAMLSPASRQSACSASSM